MRKENNRPWVLETKKNKTNKLLTQRNFLGE